jgi:hypothetical protein
MTATPDKVREAEEFYVQLVYAASLIPADASPQIAGELEEPLNLARQGLARAIDPSTMSEIRDYRGKTNAWEDHRLATNLIDRLVENNDLHIDPFDYCWEIGLEKVLNAPAESPAELIAWLEDTHRRTFDNRPCDLCGKPIAYDDLVSEWLPIPDVRNALSDSLWSDGKRYFHRDCRDAASRRLCTPGPRVS